MKSIAKREARVEIGEMSITILRRMIKCKLLMNMILTGYKIQKFMV